MRVPLSGLTIQWSILMDLKFIHVHSAERTLQVTTILFPKVSTVATVSLQRGKYNELLYSNLLAGRAYLFDQCVNVVIGPAEDRLLITGLHSVCDMFCKRCKGMVGWTYAKAYEASQKYKEGKYIIEKINLHMEESDYYTVSHPAGERSDRWRLRSMSWGNESYGNDIVYEYDPSITSMSH